MRGIERIYLFKDDWGNLDASKKFGKRVQGLLIGLIELFFFLHERKIFYRQAGFCDPLRSVFLRRLFSEKSIEFFFCKRRAEQDCFAKSCSASRFLQCRS